MRVGPLAKMGLGSNTSAFEMDIEIETETERDRKKEREWEIAWLFLKGFLFKFCFHEVTSHFLVLLNLMKQNMFVKLCLYFSSVLLRHLFLVKEAGGKKQKQGHLCFPNCISRLPHVLGYFVEQITSSIKLTGLFG